MDTKFKKGQHPWNYKLSNEKTKLAGIKMAETRKKNGWFKDVVSFSQKQSLINSGQNNPMSRTNRTREELLERARKVAETRRKNGSFKHTEEWCRKHSLSIIGENNPNWHDGISGNKYSLQFNTRLKTLIKNRDANRCIICGLTKRLTVHHVDYDKSNSKENNLVTLCGSCHSKTNFKRDLWFEYFSRSYFGMSVSNKKAVVLNNIYQYV